MTKISEALTYGLTIRESATDGSDFTNPAADYRRLFLGEDGALHLRDSSGTITGMGGVSGSTGTINVVIDGGGAEIADGIKGDLVMDFACTLTAWTLLADQSGAIVVDIWKDSYANFPPTDADAMPGSGKEPTIAASGVKAQDTAITDWTTDDVSAGDVLRFNVDSCTTIQRVTLVLTFTRA